MTLDDVAAGLRAYPGFLPGLILFGAGGLLLRDRIGRALGLGPWMTGAIILSVALILAATLMPGGDPPHTGSTCDLSRIGLPPLSDLTSLSGASLNVLLFVPLGVTLGLLERGRTKVALLVAAFLLPVAIELIQLVATPLERKCQSADVFDNLTGLALGLAGGALAGWLAHRASAQSHRHEGDR